MNTTKHTPGKWEVSEGGFSIWAKSPLNAHVRLLDMRLHAPANGIDSPANAARIVACVNACEQLEDPGKQIPEMIGVLKQFWQASESGDLDRHDWNALEQVLLELGVLE